MINTTKIKQKIGELSLTNKEISDALGVSESNLNQKLNNIIPLQLDEAELLMLVLSIEDGSFGEYFFV